MRTPFASLPICACPTAASLCVPMLGLTNCRYPGGIFDPFGFSKGNLAEYKLKELKNGR